MAVPDVGATAGRKTSLTVIAQDTAGNTAVGYAGTVRFLCGTGQRGFPAEYKFTPQDKGVHTFDGVVFPKTGRYGMIVVDSLRGNLTVVCRLAVFPQKCLSGSSAGQRLRARIDSQTAIGHFGHVLNHHGVVRGFVSVLAPAKRCMSRDQHGGNGIKSSLANARQIAVPVFLSYSFAISSADSSAVTGTGP